MPAANQLGAGNRILRWASPRRHSIQKLVFPKDVTHAGQAADLARQFAPWRHRVFYVATRAEAIYVLHAFEKKSRKTAARDLELGLERFRAIRKLRQQHGKEERG